MDSENDGAGRAEGTAAGGASAASVATVEERFVGSPANSRSVLHALANASAGSVVLSVVGVWVLPSHVTAWNHGAPLLDAQLEAPVPKRHGLVPLGCRMPILYGVRRYT